MPCERALQLLDVELRHDVILAVATALCRGSIDCTAPNSDGALEREKRRRGDMVALADFGNDVGMDLLTREEEEADLLKADLRDEIVALFIILLLHFDAIRKWIEISSDALPKI